MPAVFVLSPAAPAPHSASQLLRLSTEFSNAELMPSRSGCIMSTALDSSSAHWSSETDRCCTGVELLPSVVAVDVFFAAVVDSPPQPDSTPIRHKTAQTARRVAENTVLDQES